MADDQTPAAPEEEDPTLDGEEEDEADGSGESMSPMDFSIFLLSLNTSALMHMGLARDQEQAQLNMPMARQVIDIIAMLEEKTRGNLTGSEEQLLNQVLFDLRMRYAQRAAAME